MQKNAIIEKLKKYFYLSLPISQYEFDTIYAPLNRVYKTCKVVKKTYANATPEQKQEARYIMADLFLSAYEEIPHECNYRVHARTSLVLQDIEKIMKEFDLDMKNIEQLESVVKNFEEKNPELEKTL